MLQPWSRSLHSFSCCQGKEQSPWPGLQSPCNPTHIASLASPGSFLFLSLIVSHIYHWPFTIFCFSSDLGSVIIQALQWWRPCGWQVHRQGPLLDRKTREPHPRTTETGSASWQGLQDLFRHWSSGRTDLGHLPTDVLCLWLPLPLPLSFVWTDFSLTFELGISLGFEL